MKKMFDKKILYPVKRLTLFTSIDAPGIDSRERKTFEPTRH